MRPLDLLLLSRSFVGLSGRVSITGRALAREYAALGHRVHLVGVGGEGGSARWNSSVTVSHLGLDLSADGNQPALAQALDQFPRPDVVHALDWASAHAALPVARDWGVSLFASASVLPVPPKAPGLAGVAEAQAAVAQRARVLISTSRFAASKTVVRCGAEARRIVVVHPGVNTELFYPVRPDYLDTHPYVLAAGGDDLATVELLVAALAAIDIERRPELVLPGAHPQAVEVALAAGVGHRVEAPMPQSQFADLVRRAALAVIPRADAFSLLALEAQASGVPVLVGAEGGAAEAIVDGESGYVIDGQVPQLWAESILALLSDKKEALRLGRNGREWALTMPWALMAERLAELYYANLMRGGPTCPLP